MRRPKRMLLWVLVILFAIIPQGLLLRFRPRLAEYAENEIQYRTTQAMEQAVSEAMMQQNEAVAELSTLDGGSAAALTMNAGAAEQIRTQAVQNAYEKLNELEEKRLSVSIGTLIDPQYMAGIGPEIPFCVVGLGMVSSSMDSEFVDSGINQTKYSVILHLSSKVQLHALWYSRTVLIENDYPLTETVIVGEVPTALVQ